MNIHFGKALLYQAERKGYRNITLPDGRVVEQKPLPRTMLGESLRKARKLFQETRKGAIDYFRKNALISPEEANAGDITQFCRKNMTYTVFLTQEDLARHKELTDLKTPCHATGDQYEKLSLDEKKKQMEIGSRYENLWQKAMNSLEDLLLIKATHDLKDPGVPPSLKATYEAALKSFQTYRKSLDCPPHDFNKETLSKNLC